MTSERNTPMTCDEFGATIGDLLDGTVTTATREQMDSHRLDCAECEALAADFIRIKAEAAALPPLTSSRDLWDGVEARIGAEVLELAPFSPLAAAMPGWHGRRVTPWRAAAAAAVLIVGSSVITWSVTSRSAATVAAVTADSGFATAMAATRNERLASGQTLDETYDREIAALRAIVNAGRAEMDSTTLAVVERNLVLIDQAIAESKAALAQSPTSAFLLERLTDAYDSKLRTLRAVASIQPRG